MISDHDPNADFSSYKTYGWLDREDSIEGQLPDHLRIRLRRVTEEVLAEKGLEPAPAPPQTDLLLTYHFGATEEFQVNYMPYSPYRTWGYGYWGGYGVATPMFVDTPKELWYWTSSMPEDASIGVVRIDHQGDAKRRSRRARRIQKAITKLTEELSAKPPK